MKPRSLGAGLVALAFALLSAAPAQAVTSLYPDLRTQAPTDLRFDNVTYANRSFKALRFTNTAWNPGQGALEIRGRVGGGASVMQRIYDDAGAYTDLEVADDFFYHPTHNHFHLPDFAQYQLWTKAGWDAHVAGGRQSGAPRYSGAKVSFCLMDTSMVQRLAGTPSSARYTQCGNTFQGISVGWGDTYGSYLDEQWIDLGSSLLPNGDYVLRSVADPLNRLYESPSRADAAREGAAANEAIRVFRVKARKITLL